jgi:hypothetical protein
LEDCKGKERLIEEFNWIQRGVWVFSMVRAFWIFDIVYLLFFIIEGHLAKKH